MVRNFLCIQATLSHGQSLESRRDSLTVGKGKESNAKSVVPLISKKIIVLYLDVHNITMRSIRPYVQSILQDSFQEFRDKLHEVLISHVWRALGPSLQDKLVNSVESSLRFNKLPVPSKKLI